MLDHASRRFTSRWRRAARLPTVIVSTATTATSVRNELPLGHKEVSCSAAVSGAAERSSEPITRTRPAKPAALLATARKPPTAAGAPAYTSGAQKWKGTAEILKANPA